jgi:Tetratricopeptide repeat
LVVEVIEAKKGGLGTKDPNVLTDMFNLAGAYSGQGRWKEAEELNVEVLETRKRVLGADCCEAWPRSVLLRGIDSGVMFYRCKA